MILGECLNVVKSIKVSEHYMLWKSVIFTDPQWGSLLWTKLNKTLTSG